MRIALAITLLLALGRVAFADDPPAGDQSRGDKGVFGIGVVLGEPTGVSAKLYLRDDRAIDLGVGEAFAASGLDVHGDYLFHPWILQNRDTFVLPVYLGPGLRFLDYAGGADAPSHIGLGLRGVVGILFDFKSVPLDVFLEGAIIGQYDFKSGNGFGIGGSAGAGVRYYF
ncbi:MAG TPA: hypothetical protein VGG74_29420 [Kofleriaceae bacterium]|jgi:hypothetical protein